MKTGIGMALVLCVGVGVIGCWDSSEQSGLVGGLSVVAPGAQIKKLADGFQFTEGPAADAAGNVFFSDIPNNKIFQWTLGEGLSEFSVNSGGANGLYFASDGSLVACAGSARMLYKITPDGKVQVLADNYDGKKLNSPNDLWIDPKGGIYFTDPRYGGREGLEQDGEHVYYIPPSGRQVWRVIADLVRPNGVIGTPDGKTLYVADHGDNKIWAYTIQADGTLTNKRLFASEGSDGMTLDSEGNVYLTNEVVAVYNAAGQRKETIAVPEQPANVTFGGSTRQILFITARTSLYAIPMRVRGAY